MSQGVNRFCFGKFCLEIEMLFSVVMTLKRLVAVSFDPFIPSPLFTMPEINNEALLQEN